MIVNSFENEISSVQIRYANPRRVLLGTRFWIPGGRGGVLNRILHPAEIGSRFGDGKHREPSHSSGVQFFVRDEPKCVQLVGTWDWHSVVKAPLPID